MNAPTYDGTTVPCIGDLKDMPGFEDVRVVLGPVDRNQVRLFLAIEDPDWKSPTPRPAVPFAGWKEGDPLPVFGTIGHLYECIQEYFDLIYPGAGGPVTLWEKVYDPQSIQIDLFNFTSAAEYHPDEEYPTFDVFFPLGAPAAKAREIADTMIGAITEQGEGRDAELGRAALLAARFVPAPCLRLYRFDFPVHDYVAAVHRGEAPALPAPRATPLAVSRRDYRVRFHPLFTEQHALLATLDGRRTLGEALAALDGPEPIDPAVLRSWLRLWLGDCFFAAVERTA